MPPIFFSHDFEFENNLIPEHFESEDAAVAERDPTKFWLEYFEWFDVHRRESWPLAVDVDDLETAELLKAARIKYLEGIGGPKLPEEQLEIIGSVAIHEPEITEETVQSSIHDPSDSLK